MTREELLTETIEAARQAFGRTDKSPEKRGVMDNWFLRDDVTLNDVLDFLRSRILLHEKAVLEAVKKEQLTGHLPNTLTIDFYIRDDKDDVEQMRKVITFDLVKSVRFTRQIFEEIIAQFITGSKILNSTMQKKTEDWFKGGQSVE